MFLFKTPLRDRTPLFLAIFSVPFPDVFVSLFLFHPYFFPIHRLIIKREVGMLVFRYMSEIYIPIKGYEGSYEVSDHGNVKSLSKVRYHNAKPQHYSERLLKKEKTYKGYQRVMLANFGDYKKIYVHRLVAEHFVSNPDNKPQVNHKNCRKFDNRAKNLEWVTPLENTTHYRLSA